MIRGRGLLSVALVVGLTACGSAYDKIDPKTGIPILPVPELGLTPASNAAPGLVPLRSCDDLVQIFRAQAVHEMASQLQSAFNSAWQQHDHCTDKPPWYYGSPDGSAMMADAGMAPIDPGTEESPEHSETNNQVAGVDEADFVKTDGKHIYILSGDSLRVLKAWPADQTQELSRVTIAGEARKLFVYGDRALVYSALGTTSYNPYGGYGSGDCTYGYDCVPTGDGRPTKITVLDISDRTNPMVVRELRLSSSLLAARRIGSAVHTVVTSAPVGFSSIEYYPEIDICSSTRYAVYVAYKKLLQKNVKLINSTPLADLFPTAQDQVVGSATPGPSPFGTCKGFYKASVNGGQQFTSVLSLQIDSESPSRAVTIISKPGIVYASADALYLAVPQQRDDYWGWYQGHGSEQEATTIHRFLLTNNAPPESKYVASGVVKGRLLNQFALDEHKEHLRLASTTGHVGYSSSAHNTLTVLKQQGALLNTVGQLDKLAPTEDIRSVRFDGERGYVVTFKKTDPLFVLDLSLPAAPKVLGELKIPGFSTYMQRMDDNHLLTIGYDADDQGSFAWFTGVMLQIFDVTVPTQPKLKFKHVIGTRGSSSEALTNHLAFTYYAPKDLLAIPMTVCEDSQGGGSYGMDMTFSGLMVFDVTADTGFSLHGKVTHPVSPSATCSNWWTDASSAVKRSLIIGDFVYSISEQLIKVNALSDLNVDLVSLSL